MKKQLLIFLLLAVALSPIHAKVYKWTDEKGEVQYSDKPHAGAELVKIPKASTIPLPAGAAEEPLGAGTAASDGTYETFSIAEPENGQTIRSNEGVITLSFFLQPALQEGHKIILFLDGQRMKGEHSSTRLSIRQVERGTHTLKADLLDSEGNVLASTKSVVIHLRKEAIAETGEGEPDTGEKPFAPNYAPGTSPGYKPNYQPSYKPK
jgi:hypothetical protein